MAKLNKKEIAKKTKKLLPYIVPVVEIILLYAADAYAQGVARGITPAAARAAAIAARAEAIAARLAARAAALV